MANKAYKFRLYPDEAQSDLIRRTFGCCRKVWNLMLADKIAAYEATGKHATFTPAMYKEEFPFLREVDSMALCNEQMNLQRAFRNFWRDKRTGFPKWKSKKHPKRSYTTNRINGNIEIAGSQVKLPKLGWVRCKVHRRIPSGHAIKSVTVSENAAGRFFASVLTEYEPEPVEPRPAEPSLGLDYSSPEFFVAPDGATPGHPRPYKKMQHRLALEQRRLSRMEKGSENYQKQKRKIGRIHQRIADIRRDWIEKESAAIAKRYATIGIEDLDMRGMAASLNFGKAVHDNAWGMFAGRLERKASERGGRVVRVWRWFPSSRLCRECGCKNEGLTLADREWECPECGARHGNRDAYAAETIRLEALRTWREGIAS